MATPSSPPVEKHGGAGFLPRVQHFVVGLAQDFWKDGTENPFAFTQGFGAGKFGKPVVAAKASRRAATLTSPAGPQIWHAAPGEISEKCGGDGCLAPCDELLAGMLMMPLNLNKNMSVLDLSAGLGERLRVTIEKHGASITGLDPDPEIAARGMELSRRAGKAKHAPITHYDPNNFSTDQKYDCIMARETFYRVANRDAFIAKLGACAKAEAQISFTDYIVNPEDREKPAITAWQAFEKIAAPLGLVETAQLWGKVGFSLRVHDDQTAFYKNEVQQGLKRFADFLASGVTPDASTKKAIARRIQIWAHRVAAMEQGMKFIRFYGVKH